MDSQKHLISAQILKFYEKDFNEEQPNSVKYFKDDVTLNLDLIYQLLFESELNKSFESLQVYQYKDFLQCYRKLKPVFKQCLEAFEDFALENLNLQWLGGNVKYLITALNKKLQSNEIDNVECTLMITATLEYALGSVYYTLSKKRTPPHLLRDLLNTDILYAFFGKEMIAFLKILLGTPKSINLRNIVWHGFPTPHDIPTYYIVILICVIHTLGRILKEKQLNIIYRAQVDDFTSFISMLQKDFPAQDYLNFAMSRIYLEDCTLLNQEYKKYWQKLFEYIQSGDYVKFIILILPQIELILRLKYQMVNNFDVSAKLDEYYITMDSIFEEFVPNGTENLNVNKLLCHTTYINEGALHLMYDLFVAPNGPRLRDKVSHGEVAMESLNNSELSNILFYLSFNLLMENNSKFSLDFYESKFHLNYRTRENILKANSALDKLIIEHVPEFIKSDNIIITHNRLNIFLRPKNENVYMLLICRIAELTSQTAENYVESINTKQKLLLQHELRSNRRRTFENLLSSLSAICTCLYQILKSVANIFEMLIRTKDDIFADERGYGQRFLKHILKITENFVKYSHKDSNEWIKGKQLCEDFDSLCKRDYYHKLIKWE